MTGGGRKSADAILIAALAAGRTVREAADAAGVAERTVYRRLDCADFRSLVAAVRGEMVARATGQLADAAAEAVATLRDLLACESGSVRLGAARSILEIGSKLRETTELEARIAALEKTLKERPQ